MKKRTREIQIGFVATVAAAALAGCSAGNANDRDWQQCVDQGNRVVQDTWCDSTPTSGTGYHGGGYYHWLYTPRPFATGDAVTGGRPTPQTKSVTRASGSATTSSISRGGFGSTAHASSGGGGGGGGE